MKYMFDDARDVPEGEYSKVPVERVVDRITMNGVDALELCFAGQLGALGSYVPRFSGASPRFGFSTPRDPVFAAACWAYLRQRSRELVGLAAISAWAIAHRWPGPERFGGAPADTDAVQPSAQPSVLTALTENGRYDLRLTFLLNQMIAVWDPRSCQFRFPDIPDHATAAACRAYLRHSALALYDHPVFGPSPVGDPMSAILEYANANSWPELGMLSDRVALWRTLRS